jgi:hypothetical protein
MSSAIGLDVTSITDLLHGWLSRYITNESLAWLNQKSEQIASGATARVFFTTFSAVPRYVGKTNLELTPEDLQVAQSLRSGWFPRSLEGGSSCSHPNCTSSTAR